VSLRSARPVRAEGEPPLPNLPTANASLFIAARWASRSGVRGCRAAQGANSMPQKSRNLTFISKECIALAVRLVNEPSGERPTVPHGTSLAAQTSLFPCLETAFPWQAYYFQLVTIWFSVSTRRGPGSKVNVMKPHIPGRSRRTPSRSGSLDVVDRHGPE
jgi:hypothetical protein